MRRAGKAFIPRANAHLEGMAKVNEDLVAYMHSRSPQRTATLDMDATLVATLKAAALYGYEHFKAYQPINTYWDEQGIVLHSEFRDGNVPAGYEQLRVLKEALALGGSSGRVSAIGGLWGECGLVVDHGAVFEPECHNEEVGLRTSVGGQADESHPAWSDRLARAYPEPCSGFGDSVGYAVFGLSTPDRGTKDHSPTCAGSLLRGCGSQNTMNPVASASS